VRPIREMRFSVGMLLTAVALVAASCAGLLVCERAPLAYVAGPFLVIFAPIPLMALGFWLFPIRSDPSSAKKSQGPDEFREL
jgi:hypothetical protein